MINKSELRVGNKVFWAGAEVVLTENNLLELLTNNRFDILSPISLEEKYLRPLGFDFEGSEAGDDGNMELGEQGDEWYFLIMFSEGRYTEKEHFGLWILKDGTESIKIPFERCKFIHQIQNIYYDLTGKELIQ